MAVPQAATAIKGCNTEGFGLPLDLEAEMFPLAYRVGARIYSFSITAGGEARHYKYGDEPRQLDSYCYKHQDFLVVSAVGNGGLADTAHMQRVRPPSNSKNGLAVGAHYNIQEASQAEDILNVAVLVPNSSRGPTVDGRIKPEVCGPGFEVASARMGPTPGTQTCDTVQLGGTSMATPIVAGAAVLVSQYFRDGYYPAGVKRPQNAFQPMGALLKAVMVHSGRPLVVPHPTDKRTFVPSGDQGWGGVDLSTTVVTPSSPSGHALKVYGEWTRDCGACPVIYDGETLQFDLKINPANPRGLPLKVTLAWYDKPASTRAVRLAVNDLDLTVEEEEDEVFVLSGGHLLHFPNGRGKPDPINSVEHITIPFPRVGTTYTVKVKGRHLALQHQYFALVVSGPFDRDQIEETTLKRHPARRKVVEEESKSGGGSKEGRDGGGRGGHNTTTRTNKNGRKRRDKRDRSPPAASENNR